MGRGNFCPAGIMTDQWFIDYHNYYEENDGDWYISFDLMNEEIEMALMEISKRFPSFNFVSKCVDSYWDQFARLENEFFWVGTADNEWSSVIWISERRDLDTQNMGLAMRHIDSYRNAIRRILLDIFGEIHLRNGAWMSTKWTKEMEVVENEVHD